MHAQVDFSKCVLLRECKCSCSHSSLLELEITKVMNGVARGTHLSLGGKTGSCFPLSSMCRTVYPLSFSKDVSLFKNNKIK